MVSPSPLAAPANKEELPATAADTARVLIIDDDPLVGETLSLILESAGHEVDFADNGRAGLTLASQRKFDLAIVDYEMPEIDGLRVLIELREIQPGCQRVLCSGNLNVPLVVDGINRGEFSRVLPKPVRVEAAAALVQGCLEARRRAATLATNDGSRAEFETCLTGDYLSLALQPICDRENRAVAFEGLLRSRHPLYGSPLAVLRLAEEHNRYAQVADVVAALAAGTLVGLPGDWKLFINAHPRELSDPKLLERRLEQLEPWRHRLVFEITERTYMLSLTDWVQSVDLLTECGFGIAIDDLGSGYNSLLVLASLEPRYLKVDMNMTRGIDQNPRRQRLIEMLVRFAESTDALVIAEGIETASEARAMRGCGVHLLQGYHFARPSTDLELSRTRLHAPALPL